MSGGETERTRRRRRHSSSNGEEASEDNRRVFSYSDNGENETICQRSNVGQMESTPTVSPRTSYPPADYPDERRSAERRDATYEQQQHNHHEDRRLLFESDESVKKSATAAYHHNNSDDRVSPNVTNVPIKEGRTSLLWYAIHQICLTYHSNSLLHYSCITEFKNRFYIFVTVRWQRFLI